MKTNNIESYLTFDFFGSSITVSCIDFNAILYNIAIDDLYDPNIAFNNYDNGFTITNLRNTYHTLKISKAISINKINKCDYINIESIQSSNDNNIQYKYVTEILDIDCATKGNWIEQYGKIGYIFPTGVSNLPFNITYQILNANRHSIFDCTKDNRPLRITNDTNECIKEYWRNYHYIDIVMKIHTHSSVKISLYLFNINDANYPIKLEIFELYTNQLISSSIYKHWKDGIYITFSAHGDIRIILTNDESSNDFVYLSGIFIDKIN
jgi:hypothetical protein